MKKNAYYPLLITCCFFASAFGSSVLRGQTTQPAFCADMLAKANNLLSQNKYDEARTFCEAALPLCPNAASDLQSVLNKISKAIDAEKKAAVDAKDLANSNLKKAKNAEAV